MAERVTVAVRVRPPSCQELRELAQCVVQAQERKITLIDPLGLQLAATLSPKSSGSRKADLDSPSEVEEDTRNQTRAVASSWKRSFAYDHVFWSADPEDPTFASQQQVYTSVGQEVLANAWKGYNCAVFAYGQTGSGKSYTMMGPSLTVNSEVDPDEYGLIPRLCHGLFEKVEELRAHQFRKTSQKGKSQPHQQVSVSVSYLEIYNETAKDLFGESKPLKGGLRIREHPQTGAYVENLSIVPVRNYSEMAALLEKGSKQRTIAATNMNAASSRSHAIFTVILRRVIAHDSGNQGRNEPTSELVSKISLVDLAGSERNDVSGATGERLREAVNINKSLSTLGDVIKALADGARQSGPSGSRLRRRTTAGAAAGPGGGTNTSSEAFIPYRNSLLTWLLKDSLGGNSKTYMIATISPCSTHYAETLSTLKYVHRAKRIVNIAEVNETGEEALVKKLKAEISSLKDQLKLEKEQRRLLQEERLARSEDEDSRKLVEHTPASRKAELGRHISLGSEAPTYVEQQHTKSGLPRLVNLNPDIRFSHRVTHYLDEGVTTVRGDPNEEAHSKLPLSSSRPDNSAAASEILLPGRWILADGHCELLHDSGEVFLFPCSDEAEIFVNGRRVVLDDGSNSQKGDCLGEQTCEEDAFRQTLDASTKGSRDPITEVSAPVRLLHGSRILLGRYNFYCFLHPSQQVELAENSSAEEDLITWEDANKEIRSSQPSLNLFDDFCPMHEFRLRCTDNTLSSYLVPKTKENGMNYKELLHEKETSLQAAEEKCADLEQVVKRLEKDLISLQAGREVHTTFKWTWEEETPEERRKREDEWEEKERQWKEIAKEWKKKEKVWERKEKELMAREQKVAHMEKQARQARVVHQEKNKDDVEKLTTAWEAREREWKLTQERMEGEAAEMQASLLSLCEEIGRLERQRALERRQSQTSGKKESLTHDNEDGNGIMCTRCSESINTSSVSNRASQATESQLSSVSDPSSTSTLSLNPVSLSKRASSKESGDNGWHNQSKQKQAIDKEIKQKKAELERLEAQSREEEARWSRERAKMRQARTKFRNRVNQWRSEVEEQDKERKRWEVERKDIQEEMEKSQHKLSQLKEEINALSQARGSSKQSYDDHSSEVAGKNEGEGQADITPCLHPSNTSYEEVIKNLEHQLQNQKQQMAQERRMWEQILKEIEKERIQGSGEIRTGSQTQQKSDSSVTHTSRGEEEQKELERARRQIKALRKEILQLRRVDNKRLATKDSSTTEAGQLAGDVEQRLSDAVAEKQKEKFRRKKAEAALRAAREKLQSSQERIAQALEAEHGLLASQLALEKEKCLLEVEEMKQRVVEEAKREAQDHIAKLQQEKEAMEDKMKKQLESERRNRLAELCYMQRHIDYLRSEKGSAELKSDGVDRDELNNHSAESSEIFSEAFEGLEECEWKKSLGLKKPKHTEVVRQTVNGNPSTESAMSKSFPVSDIQKNELEESRF